MSELHTGRGEAGDVRIGEVLNDYLDRRARGQAEPETELLSRHPELADELRSHLDMIRGLQSERTTLEALVAQGVLEPCDESGYAARLGPYKIFGYIGRGGMGIVLKAYEESLNRTVALKILRPELAEDTKALARFTREARAAAALRHPNIVTVHAVGRERGVHFLAMEYIEGPTLSEAIGQGFAAAAAAAFKPRGTTRAAGFALRGKPARDESRGSEMIRDLFRQLLSGLSAAHDTGLIHRDIKSSNILLDGWPGQSAVPSPESPVLSPQPCVKIADFGLARMLSARTQMTVPGSVLGTPDYMSPEQARGDESIDHHTDLYSAGVVLYEMLTGRTPFKADTPSAVIHQILHDEPADPRTIAGNTDPHLASLALRLMAKRPEDRFDSASEVIAALDAGTRVQSLAKRRRLRRQVPVGLLVLALSIGGVWSLSRLGGPPTIANVKIDETKSTRILATYGDDPTWKVFHDFPPEAFGVDDVVLLDLNGRGSQAVAVGVHKPLDGRCVFMFGPDGRQTWALDLSSKRQWPDCAPPTEFRCRCLAKADLDGKPGDELVVVANEVDQYAARVSILDPRTQVVRSTFWHMGTITQMLVAPDFLGPGRPAIIAQGHNNKLDGFHERLDDDKAPLTVWDMVQVVMVLDPTDLDGLGPPPCKRRIPDIPPARPRAYAFLDRPYSTNVADVSEGWANPRYPGPADVALVGDMKIEQCPDGETSESCIRFPIQRREGQQGGAFMTLNPNLEPCRVMPSLRDRVRRIEDDCYRYWHPIIQNREYVGRAVAWAEQSTLPP